MLAVKPQDLFERFRRSSVELLGVAAQTRLVDPSRQGVALLGLGRSFDGQRLVDGAPRVVKVARLEPGGRLARRLFDPRVGLLLARSRATARGEQHNHRRQNPRPRRNLR
ncbi:MAG TPA: hypothetical protein DD670_13720 [Planctomycetaceae bacterium]|nr:hypothetical protein [Planctomycetaceae bacterium]